MIAKIKPNVNFTEFKRILIAGANSYIGESLRKYIEQFDNYVVDIFDTTIDAWKQLDFSKYDVVCDVAGIAHIKETKKNRQLYYWVNRDLAVQIAEKAKKEGVKQFIYLSSMNVYGLTEGRINEKTPTRPNTAYGKSKLEAEELLWKLSDERFCVSVVRPPMVYGKGCKGNYQRLRAFAIKFGVFPEYDNFRSLIYITNLLSAIRGIIHNQETGVYFPQNYEYMKSFDMVKWIAEFNGKKLVELKGISVLIRGVILKSRIGKKVFGILTYEKEMNVPETWLVVKDNKRTVELSEKGE